MEETAEFMGKRAHFRVKSAKTSFHIQAFLPAAAGLDMHFVLVGKKKKTFVAFLPPFILLGRRRKHL